MILLGLLYHNKSFIYYNASCMLRGGWLAFIEGVTLASGMITLGVICWVVYVAP